MSTQTKDQISVGRAHAGDQSPRLLTEIEDFIFARYGIRVSHDVLQGLARRYIDVDADIREAFRSLGRTA